jgi:hypothetical protein
MICGSFGEGTDRLFASELFEAAALESRPKRIYNTAGWINGQDGIWDLCCGKGFAVWLSKNTSSQQYTWLIDIDTKVKRGFRRHFLTSPATILTFILPN